MRKIYNLLILLIIPLVLSACHGDGIGMDMNKDVVNPQISDELPSFELGITLIWPITDIRMGFPNVEGSLSKYIEMRATRDILLEVEVRDAGTNPSHACYGQTQLSEEDYQYILDYVAAADLKNYEPPYEFGEGCEEENVAEDYAINIGYKIPDEAYSLKSAISCEAELVIKDLVNAFTDMATKYFPDCNEDTFEIVPPSDEDLVNP